jgi:photosystem II stability/assembly factor-like uncharacterized protein
MCNHTVPKSAAVLLLTAALYTLLILPAVMLKSPPQSKAVVWERIGREMTSHAPVLALALHPGGPDVVLAGAYHDPGLYVTTSGGESWSASVAGLEGLSVFALLPDPTDARTVYLGAINGLYRSMDGGHSWDAVAGELPNTPVYALAMDYGGKLYVGTDGHGLYVSTDGGRTVVRVGQGLAQTTILSLAVDDSERTIVAGTSGGGLYVSYDEGGSWEQAPELKASFVSHVALDAGSNSGFACSRDGLWRTEDNGHSWTRADSGLEGRVNVVIFHPCDRQTVLAGTARGDLFRSDDGGRTWERWASLERAIYTIAVHPAHPERVYVGAWDGVYSSSDGGTSWQQRNRGLGSVPIEALVLDEQDPRFLWAGNTFDGVYRSTDGGSTWTKTAGGLEEGERGYGVLSLARPPSNENLLYAGTDGRGVYVSADGGDTWVPTGTGLQTGIGAIAVHPGDESHIYVRAFYDRVYESTDGGSSWHPCWEGMSETLEIISLTMDGQRPSVLYAGSEDGLYITNDGASSWRRAGLEGMTVFCVAIHPHDRDLVYAGTTRGVYRSSDGGQTWQAWGEELAQITVSALVLDPDDPRTIYAGTKYHGCFSSEDAGRTWLPSSDGLAVSSVDSLVFHPDGDLLYAGTPDGVYRGVVQ